MKPKQRKQSSDLNNNLEVTHSPPMHAFLHLNPHVPAFLYSISLCA